MRVLVVDDEERLAAALRRGLEAEGIAVDVAHTGTDGLWLARENEYDVLVLDIMMPGMSGYAVCRTLRDEGDTTPILMLTAKDGDWDQIEALDTGADDYLTKPFSRVELLARLQAIRRRRVPAPVLQPAFDDGRVRIDFVGQQAYLEGRSLTLTPTEYRLLGALVRHAGQILSADQLIEMAWDDSSAFGPARVKYVVLRLRRKLGWDSDDTPLQTVRGFGYRYQPPS